MAYRRQNIFYFDSVAETGVDKIPVNSTILIKDIGKEIIKTTNDNLTATTSIQQALNLGSAEEIKNFDLTIALPNVQLEVPLKGYPYIELQATIINYDPTQTYSFGIESGEIISFIDGVLTFTLTNNAQSKTLISCYASKPGYPNTPMLSKNINIIGYGEDTTWAMNGEDTATLIS